METIFDRMLAERGKRGWVRDQVMAGAPTRKGKHPSEQSFVEHYAAEFIKNFDSLDEGTPEAVFAAVEAAFHLGKTMRRPGLVGSTAGPGRHRATGASGQSSAQKGGRTGRSQRR